MVAQRAVLIGRLALANAALASCVAPLSRSFRCEGDGDCAWGWLCDGARRVCVAPAELEGAVSCETPGSESTCGAGRLCCGDRPSCASCPSGAEATACSGAGDCVATACRAGWTLCGGRCRQWNIQTLIADVGRLFGDGTTALALDSRGWAHITYHENVTGNDLGYIQWNGDTWGNTLVDTAGMAGEYSSLALGLDDQPHITWYDASGGALRYVKLCPGCPPPTTLDDSADVGKHTSVALDGSDRPHIVYFDQTNYDLLHVGWDGGQWVNEPPVATAGSAGESAALAIDGLGGLHAVYGANQNIVYSHNDTGAWQHEIIEAVGSAEAHAALALDLSGRAHIAYRYNSSSSEAGVKYVRWLGDAFSAAEVVDGCTDCGTTQYVGSHVSIAVDSRGGPHIVYFAGGYTQDHGLKYAARAGGSWCAQYVERGMNVGEYTSLAVDAGDVLHVSYLANGALQYATGAE